MCGFFLFFVWVEANLCRVFSVCIYVQCIAVGDPVIKMGELGSSYQDGRVGIQLSRWASWDPVIKMGELGSSYQDGSVGDPVIKMGELGSSYQDGGVGIHLSRWESWRSSYQDGRVGIPYCSLIGFTLKLTELLMKS